MEPLKNYAHIRGVCHNPHPQGGHESLEREMGYCQRLQLNAVRFWMSMDSWEQQGNRYFDDLDHFMRTAWRYGVSSMPILWNGNFCGAVEFLDTTGSEYSRGCERKRR
jgi:hypothetical protein